MPHTACHAGLSLEIVTQGKFWGCEQLCSQGWLYKYPPTRPQQLSSDPEIAPPLFSVALSVPRQWLPKATQQLRAVSKLDVRSPPPPPSFYLPHPQRLGCASPVCCGAGSKEHKSHRGKIKSLTGEHGGGMTGDGREARGQGVLGTVRLGSFFQQPFSEFLL